MKCFYHNDPDGKCAGFWVANDVNVNDKSYYRDEPKMYAIDYRTKFPLEIVRPDEQIYIVDYSISTDEMWKLLDKTQNVTWIDHHKTAIEMYEGFEHEIRGIRYDGIAASMLTYCYIKHMTHNGEGNIKTFDLSMMNDAPWFTKLIADWDVWKHEYGDNARNFIVAFDAYDFNPTSSEWNKFKKYENYENSMIEEGKVMAIFRDGWAKEYMNLGFETVFEGYKCYAVNLGCCGSEYFKSLPEDKYDIFIRFVFDGIEYSFSMYSKTVDVSEIAKKYGGGGHKLAAGFQCKKLPFKKCVIN